MHLTYDPDISYIASIEKEIQPKAADGVVQKLQKNIAECLGVGYQMKLGENIENIITFSFISKVELANERQVQPTVHIEKIQLKNGTFEVNVIVNSPKKPAISDDFLNRTYDTEDTQGKVTTGLCAQLAELLKQAPLKFKDVRNSNFKNDDGTQIFPASYKIEGSLSSEVRISYATYSHENKIAEKLEKAAALTLFKSWIQKVKSCVGANYVFYEGVEENKFYICTVRIKNDNDAASKIDIECRPNRDGTYYVELKVFRYSD